MNYPDHDLENATDAMDAAIDSVNLVITMDVALCLDIKWPIAIVGGRTGSMEDLPTLSTICGQQTDVTIDQFTEGYGELVRPDTVPPFSR